MATKTKLKNESREVMDVDWDAVAGPLDVTVTRNGSKVPRRKVRVRGIVGVECPSCHKCFRIGRRQG